MTIFLFFKTATHSQIPEACLQRLSLHCHCFSIFLVGCVYWLTSALLLSFPSEAQYYLKLPSITSWKPLFLVFFPYYMFYPFSHFNNLIDLKLLSFWWFKYDTIRKDPFKGPLLVCLTIEILTWMDVCFRMIPKQQSLCPCCHLSSSEIQIKLRAGHLWRAGCEFFSLQLLLQMVKLSLIYFTLLILCFFSPTFC